MQLSRFVVSGFAAFALVLCWVTLPAAAATYQAGQDYRVLDPVQPTVTDPAGKVEVAEVFWYGCPHCFAFEPHLAAWLKKLPPDVAFVHLPAAFGPVWTTHAKAFYTEKDMGIVDRFHRKVFNAIHEDGKRLASEDALAKFFAAHGVNQKQFRQTFESFKVQTQIGRSKSLVRDYGIMSVPALVIGGHYWTNPQMAGSFDKMLKITNFLVAKERRAKQQ